MRFRRGGRRSYARRGRAGRRSYGGRRKRSFGKKLRIGWRM